MDAQNRDPRQGATCELPPINDDLRTMLGDMTEARGLGRPPKSKTVSLEEAQKTATDQSKSILEDFKFLKALLQRHEVRIQKRWAKKGRTQRRKVICDAWGGEMAESHRPDLEVFHEQESWRKGSRYFRERFIWPFINQEDLCSPNTLPMFLNTRGRTHPSDIAAADFKLLYVGIWSMGIAPVSLDRHTMMMNGQYEPGCYGKLVSWDSDPDARNLCESGIQMNPGEGLLVLESQERTMKFLIACALRILHDIPASTILNYQALEAPSIAADSTTGLAALAVVAAETPYRPPAQLSFQRLESILSAKRDAAADHIWSLRDDPSQFSGTMLAGRDHFQRPTQDFSREGLLKPFAGTPDHLWTRIVTREVHFAYISLEVWANLQEQSAELQKIQVRFRESVKPTQPLPSEYMDAILKFKDYLNIAAESCRGMLRNTVLFSPPMRRFYQVKLVYGITGNEVDVFDRRSPKLDTKTARLLDLLDILCYYDLHNSFAPFITVMDDLQRMIDTDSGVKSLISPYVAAIIADLSILNECIRQLDSFQPYARTYGYYMVKNSGAIQSEYEKCVKPWLEMAAVISGPAEGIAHLGAPVDTRFHYPVHKSRSKANVKAMRQAEANLDAFWGAFDKLLYEKRGNIEQTALCALLKEPRSLQRTPEWKEPNHQSEEHESTTVNTDALVRPFSELYFDLEARTESTVDKTKTEKGRKRTKTKGLAAPGPEPDGAPEPPQHGHEDSTPAFEVDKRALGVFKTLFYTPSASATPGQVVWKDFLHAMKSVGFASQKLYGSAWQFQPTEFGLDRGILFHEPHPVAKLPYHIARGYGRRLDRAYGWHGGMFVLAKVKDSQ